MKENTSVSEVGDSQVLASQRPTTNDKDTWEAYWRSKDQPWRSKPEIDAERQQYLEAMRTKASEEHKYVPPFKDVSLSRADVEWLLVTHEDGVGPIDWNDQAQHTRARMDLSGADMQGIDLNGLPLARTEFVHAHLEKAQGCYTHLEGANLFEAHLEGAC